MKNKSFYYTYNKLAWAYVIVGFVAVFSYGAWPELMALFS